MSFLVVVFSVQDIFLLLSSSSSSNLHHSISPLTPTQRNVSSSSFSSSLPLIPGLQPLPSFFYRRHFSYLPYFCPLACRRPSRARVIAGGCRICRQFPAIVPAISPPFARLFCSDVFRPIDVGSRSFHLGAGLVSLVGQKQTSK